MTRLLKVICVGAVSSLLIVSGVACTKKPNQEEVSRLDEAKAAAEGAEKKLSELRQERVALEQELQVKQGELSNQKE
jgi:hypothetical protein